MSTIRKAAALGATTVVAAGALVAGAGAASAASDPGFAKVKAPKTVTAGKSFRLTCQLDNNNNWAGAKAFLQEKAASINAWRPVDASGNCNFNVVLFATGPQKIRVIVEQNGGAIRSKWVKVNVQ